MPLSGTSCSAATSREPDGLRDWPSRHCPRARCRGQRRSPLIEQAIREAEQALAIDPHSVRALQSLAYAHGGLLLLRTGIDRDEVLRKATQAATRAIELDPADAYSYALRSLAILRGRQMDRYAEALADARRAQHADPNQIQVLRVMAALEAAIGEHERSIEHAHQVVRQSPRDPLGYINFGLLAFASLGARRYADGAAWASRALEIRPRLPRCRMSMPPVPRFGSDRSGKGGVQGLAGHGPGLCEAQHRGCVAAIRASRGSPAHEDPHEIVRRHRRPGCR